jgi:DNA mismatch repair protein MutS2
LPGIVHGVSGSGATVFLEPLETVDLNNEIVTLRDQESVEVQRLLQEYTDLLRGRLPDLHALTHAIGRLDLVIAKARVARAMRAVPAELSSTERIILEEARHPLVEASLRSHGGTITPLDLTLAEGTRVLMISGPNTGGKTVALKTVGLLSLMCQSGLLVPAERAVLPVFRTLFIDIGDRQSISDQLSTFSARMTTIAAMTRGLASPSLVLLDEVGTGTDPEEGVALGIAILEYFRQRGATTLATTHLEALKAHAATGDRCANAAMQFDEATFTPTYRMVHGIPGRSGALEIAERFGLPNEIMETARRQRGRSGKMISDYLSHLQDLTSELERRLRATSRQQAQMEKDRASQEKALNEREARLRQAFSDEIELALGSMREEGERYLAALKDREVAHRLRRDEAKLASSLRAEARRTIRKVAGGLSPESTLRQELAPGQTVLVRGMDLGGTIQAIQANKVTVLVRGKRLQVPREDCLPQADAAARPGLRLPPGVALNRRPAEATTQIDLRGCTVTEALEQVDKFLDDAYLNGLAQVHLIHGFGSGRLKEALAEFLSGHLHVEEYAGAPSESGGAGVTVVTLKA